MADRVRRISKMLEKFRRSSVVERNSDVDEWGVGFENLDATGFRASENVFVFEKFRGSHIEISRKMRRKQSCVRQIQQNG